jgi:hypothetical protein
LGYWVEDWQGSGVLADFGREVYEARLQTTITERSSFYFAFLHEDADFYDEDLYMAGLRRSF